MVQQKNAAFNKPLFFNNIRYLAKKSQTNIGTLEKAVGVSPGYISRTSRGSSLPSVVFLYKVAHYFHVSTDTLLFTDLTENERRTNHLIQFLHVLIEDTEEGEIIWSKADPYQLSLLKKNKDWHQNTICSSGLCTTVNNDDTETVTVYLLDVQKEKASSPQNNDFKELWLNLPETGKTQFVYCTSQKNEQLNHNISTLYDKAVENECNPPLGRDFLNAIHEIIYK